MKEAKKSHLSHPKYGYDFVVSTTQASINSGLLEYLSQSDHPVQYLCFVVDPETGIISEYITLKQFLDRSNGVNPFEIPHGTDVNDPRIQKLTGAYFLVGIKLQLGLPPGVNPLDLPDVVTFTNTASSVLFKMFCSEFTIVSNTPPGGFVKKGRWEVWEQEFAQPWYIEANVNLLVADLDRNLETAYFKNRPLEKANLKRQLYNLGDTAFSLEQLLFDLSNASLQQMPKIRGLDPCSHAADALQRSFIALYSAQAKERGLPLLAVTASAHNSDPSQLQLTAYERQVSPYKDKKGVTFKKPTKEQKAAATMDYLCASNNNDLPGTASFGWNWLHTDEIDTASGVIAINRNAIGRYFLEQLKEYVEPCCLKPIAVVKEHEGGHLYKCTIFPGQKPQKLQVTESGSDVVFIEYTAKSFDEHTVGIIYGGLCVKTLYQCHVKLEGNRITVKQRSMSNIWAKYAETANNIKAVDKILTDIYDISVGQKGKLLLKLVETKEEDHSETSNINAFINFFTKINETIHKFKSLLSHVTSLHFKAIPIQQIPNFIFPCSKVFAYKSTCFSDNQDLVCPITYVDTKQPASQPPALQPPPRSQLRLEPPSLTDAALRLDYSCELMQNYVHGTVICPANKFECLQTSDGFSLLFCVDSQGGFTVIKEQSGNSSTGWKVNELSVGLLKSYSANKEAKIRTFGVGQSAVDGSIGLALAITANGSDHLFVSLYNDSSDTSWSMKPLWESIPFDGDGADSRPITITGILFAETSDKRQYLIVDVDRAQSSTGVEIERYHIDMKSPGIYWVRNDIPVDIERGSYQSCVGRKKGAYIDGVYTAGRIKGDPQLVYTPITNVFGRGPPLSVRLGLPAKGLPSAIAAVRNLDKSSRKLYATTDLYAISGSSLYRFAADEQYDGAEGTPVVSSPLLSGTETLLAMRFDDVITLWGLNPSGQVFYFSCLADEVEEASNWTTPVPILTNIERISAYINKVDGDNTIFASGGGKLVRLVQETNTSAKVWRPQQITLEALPDQKSLSFNSYTTTLKITDANRTPVPGVEVAIAAGVRTPVYINGVYYVLGLVPVVVQSDSAGLVTIIEASEDLNAAVLTVTIPNESTSTVINPMDRSFKKLAKLDSESSLRGARVPSKTVAGGVLDSVQYEPLLPPSTAASAIKETSACLDHLRKIYDNHKLPQSTEKVAHTDFRPRVVRASMHFASPTLSASGFDRAVSAGDIFRWLQSGIRAVLDIIWDAVSGAWHFIVKIAGEAYRAVLDTVDAVLGAVRWVFEQIKAPIQKLINYLAFLFNWDDVRRTKQVLHNVFKLYTYKQIDGIEEAREHFNKHVGSLQKKLKTWSAGTDWDALGHAVSGPPSSSGKDPSEGQTSPSQLFASHFRNHARDMKIIGQPPTIDATELIVTKLIEALEAEGAVLSAAYEQLKKLVEEFGKLSVTDILKRVIGIFAGGLLSSVQVVVDALLQVLHSLAREALGHLDTEIHIPVLSDILEIIGVPKFSILDILTWIAAVAFTVGYKIGRGEAPFPDNKYIRAIISAPSWDCFETMLDSRKGALAGPSEAADDDEEEEVKSIIKIPRNIQQVIHAAGHASAGLLLFGCSVIKTLEAEEMTGENAFAVPSAVLGVIVAASTGAAEFLAPRCPIEEEAVLALSKATLAVSLAAQLTFCGPVQKALSKTKAVFLGFAVSDGRAASALVDSILVLPALVVTGWHFYELGQKPDSTPRSAAIIGEVANLTGYITRVSYTVAVNDKEESSRQVSILIMASSLLVNAGLQTARATLAGDGEEGGVFDSYTQYPAAHSGALCLHKVGRKRLSLAQISDERALLAQGGPALALR